MLLIIVVTRRHPSISFPIHQFDIDITDKNFHFRHDGDAGVIVAEPPFKSTG
ncbi:MAG: hypothetical protein HY800_02130 [Ignavibacteriales bacterium]|nr:hypothetical protein [Ignavibacteriales bacterium]